VDLPISLSSGRLAPVRLSSMVCCRAVTQLDSSRSREIAYGRPLSLTDSVSVTPPSQMMRVVVPVDMNGVALLVIQDDALAKFGALKSGRITHLLGFRIEV